MQKARAAELAYLKQLADINRARMASEMNVDVTRFKSMVDAIGADTLREVGKADSEYNVRMLSALGLRSALITDGSTPINVVSTAHGLIGRVVRSGLISSSNGV